MLNNYSIFRQRTQEEVLTAGNESKFVFFLGFKVLPQQRGNSKWYSYNCKQNSLSNLITRKV